MDVKLSKLSFGRFIKIKKQTQEWWWITIKRKVSNLKWLEGWWWDWVKSCM